MQIGSDQPSDPDSPLTVVRAWRKGHVLRQQDAFARGQERRWIVDPVDGTRDFLRGLPYWANLIALETGDGVVVGVLHLAALGKLYAAVRGGGAWRDGTRLKIRDDAVLSRCSLVFGEPDCLLSALDPETFGRLVRMVTSHPSEDRWQRTINFYKTNGFSEIGPRLQHRVAP